MAEHNLRCDQVVHICCQVHPEEEQLAADAFRAEQLDREVAEAAGRTLERQRLLAGKTEIADAKAELRAEFAEAREELAKERAEMAAASAALAVAPLLRHRLGTLSDRVLARIHTNIIRSKAKRPNATGCPFFGHLAQGVMELGHTSA
ncbi:hypothetical protein QYE76_048563 [Lolium multiflorum]|uniref:Uncharacterized protein n=1 Tax=Lolium multiflorum TaxID=4521 RepID=A0AAD8SMK9_LOLMU|nr:hypothetical protein QYE76_048563 [Lolium multiflorum]